MHCHANCLGRGQAHLERIRPSRVVEVGSVKTGAGLLKMSASTSTVLPRPICRQQWDGVAPLGEDLHVCGHLTKTQLQAAKDRVVSSRCNSMHAELVCTELHMWGT